MLDWETKPLPFKVYPALEQIRLPTDLPALAVDTFAALAPADPSAPAAPLDLERLAALLFFSAGVTRVKTYPGGAQIHFRAAASTGALYQTEAYVVAGAVEGLEPGVYHFSPGDFSLRRLRAGDFRGAVALAAADDAVAAQPASLILSGDLLAQYLEVPGAGLPPPLLGFGHAAGPAPRGGARARRARAPGHRLRGRAAQRPARPRCREGGRARGRPARRRRPGRRRVPGHHHARARGHPALRRARWTTRSCATPTTTRASTPKPRSHWRELAGSGLELRHFASLVARECRNSRPDPAAGAAGRWRGGRWGRRSRSGGRRASSRARRSRRRRCRARSFTPRVGSRPMCRRGWWISTSTSTR